MEAGGDHVSAVSSVTASDEEEKVVEELRSQTPEVPVPKYSAEELEMLASFIQRMTMLFALDHNHWTPEVCNVVKYWLMDVNEPILTIFYDGSILTALLSFPDRPVYDMMYFMREQNQIFTIEGFHDEVAFGTIHENVDESLLGVMEKVFAPMFFQYENWGENIKSNLCSALHNFLNFLTMLHYKMSGMTVLYVPSEGQNLPIDVAIKEREMLKRLETVAVFWASQIRLCLGDKQQLVPDDLLCPIDEFDFWVYRDEILQGLDTQLNHKNIIHIIKILQKAQSVYIKEIVQLSQKCREEMEEAQSNIRYLQLMVDVCTDLDATESPAQIADQLPKIVHMFRYIWLNSKFYNTKEYITGLFRALSNQIIIYCRKKININKVLDGSPRFGISMCDMSINCLMTYEEIYNIMSKEHAEQKPEVGWDLDNSAIFNHVETFKNRLYDLIDISEAMIVFGRIDDTEEIREPSFGGKQGPEFEKTCRQVVEKFQNGLNTINKVSKDAILDVHNNQWNGDVIKYKTLISSIEATVGNLISNFFLSILNIEEGVEALCTLFIFSQRKSLRNAYLSKVTQIWTMFLDEINETNRRMLEEAGKRPARLPKNAAQVIALKINLDRLSFYKDILIKAEWLPEVPQSVLALKQFDQLETNFKKSIKKTFSTWVESVGFDAINKLDRPLMVRSKLHPGLLECNIDGSVLDLCEEARHFEILGYQTPVNITQIYSKYKTIKLIYESVTTVVHDYNKILAALSNEERNLFNVLIVACDKKILPGLTKLTWGGEFSDAYISECVKHTSQLQEFLDLYKMANIKIAEICEKICDTPILKFTTTSVSELTEMQSNMEKYKTEIANQLLSYENSIIDLISVVHGGFEAYIYCVVSEWATYVQRFDEMLEEAFCLCARNSLQEIFTGLHGDGNMGPSPLISMVVDIVDGQVYFEVAQEGDETLLCAQRSSNVKDKDLDVITFTPNIQSVSSVMGNFLPTIVNAMKLFPRLCAKFRVSAKKDFKSFPLVITKDMECKHLQELITSEVDYNRSQLENYAQGWKKFEHVWTMDKDEYMKEISKTEITAAQFDLRIERYSEIANEVAMLETITTVHFIVVNSNDLKNTIRCHIDEWQVRHTELLKQQAMEKVSEIYEYMEKNIEMISTIPRTVSAMQESVKFYERLLTEVPKKNTEIPSIVDLFRVLDKNEVLISSTMRRKINNLGVEWELYLDKLKDAHEMLGNSKDSFKSNLLSEMDEFKEKAKSLLDEFNENAPTSSQIPATTAMKILERYRDKLDRFLEIQEKIISDLTILHINHVDNWDLRQLDKELRVLNDAWTLALDWENFWLSNKSVTFWQIDVDEMERKAATLFEKLHFFIKKLKDKNWDIFESVKKQINEFRKTLHLITMLRSPALRTRHWEQIRNIVMRDFDENSEDFKLQSIITMNFQAHSDEIEDLSKAALMEMQIEKGLKQVNDTSESLTIEMVYHSDGVYRVKNVDECFQTFEENIVLLSSMKSTRFVLPFAAEVDYWERTLSYVLETLEQTLNVQRQWLYLENIFVGDDIKKQLPAEFEQFMEVTKVWRTITGEMFEARTAYAVTHLKPPNFVLNTMNDLNEQLEIIQRALEVYLERKRQLFPRFYFLSNDDLLEILGNAQKPDLIQMHFIKLFDNLKKVELKKFTMQKAKGWDAIGMYSDDGEYVGFPKPVRLDGSSEVWLSLIENAMGITLRERLLSTLNDLRKSRMRRDEWLPIWPGQLCLTSSQIKWTSDCTKSLQLCNLADDRSPLKRLKRKQNQILVQLSKMSRKVLPEQLRRKVNTLITIELHGRDVVERLYKMNCRNVSDFNWFSQLRFYWERGACVIRQTNTENFYGYEYTGNSGRLVITPLTDRCYITLTTALHLHRGGSPIGPAGTGKTETVKDLGKALGIWVIVTNCSEGLDYKSLGKCFSGLSQTGTWGCFDEFNRINVEVLSVVGQQISSIFSALSQKLTRFRLNGTEIDLKPTVGLFITMNPGYAGRTELPDNLKSMFRPISMIVPDNVIIAENLLFSDGFQNTKILARKVCTLYSLAKQQLSNQHHYDFGLRSMVALFRYAGLKRRQFLTVEEEEIIYLAIKDMNMARLTSNDVPLFQGIVSDVFPGISLPSVNYADLVESIREEFKELGLQEIPIAIEKIKELYETKNSRHSVVIVGQTGSGKSTTWKVLQGAFQRMQSRNPSNWHRAIVYPINPKSLELGEIYGEYNLSTGEWSDGVLSAIMRKVCLDSSRDQKWILFDGPVDPVWIENMNSVMDDNKILTLINSERITMPQQVSLLFETDDLRMASPATISRCGIVYNDYKDWGWRPYVESWLSRQESSPYVGYLRSYFDQILDKVLDFKRAYCGETVSTNELNSVISLCWLLECLATKDNNFVNDNDEFLEKMAKLWFMFALVWTVGGTLDAPGRQRLDTFLRKSILDQFFPTGSIFPLKDTVFDYFVDPKQKAMIPWEDKLSKLWKYNKNAPFHKIIVPTVDTVRYEFIMTKFLSSGHPVMLVGPVGTGKTTTAMNVLNSIDPDKLIILPINLSAQTTASGLQKAIESRTEKRTKGVYVPIGGKKLLCFLDDFNMPEHDAFGSQPPLELIRQWIDYDFWYDRKNQAKLYIKDCSIIASMGPPGGGRQIISARTLSRFGIINVLFPDKLVVYRIFGKMLKQHLSDFPDELKQLGKRLTVATVDVYTATVQRMLPTPAKTHYLFNLRDISRVFQGLLRSSKGYHLSKICFMRLWTHECFRVFSDRMVDNVDVLWFYNQINEQLGQHCETTLNAICPERIMPIFGDFMSSNRYYEDIRDHTELRNFMEDQLVQFNSVPGVVRLDLVLFQEAIDHIVRIVRVISQPRGHILLIGIGGSGRQSLSRLASFVCQQNVFQIEVTGKYKTTEFREDLKVLYKETGAKNSPTSFLFTSEQVAEPGFLEVINNILSTGEINLFKPDEFEEIEGNIFAEAQKRGVSPTTDAIYAFFMETVRSNLHLILCMSSIGEEFRVWIRQYPALVNCTTVNMFRRLPKSALLEISKKFISDVDIRVTFSKNKNEFVTQTEHQELRDSVAEILSNIHVSVQDMSDLMASELNRRNYVSPVNYIELVAGFKDMLNKKRIEVSSNANKLRNGLQKIQDTQVKVSEMSDDLKQSQEQVTLLKNECDKFLVTIEWQTKEVDEQKKSVAAKGIVIAEEEKKCQILAQQAQVELDQVLPALEDAEKALDSLNKKDLSEVKSYGRPPAKVGKVMEAVMILLGAEPTWAEAKRQLGEANFLSDLRNFDKDNIPDKILKKIGRYTEDVELEPERVGSVSLACKSLILWIRAIENYGKVFRVVTPKKAKLLEAHASLSLQQKMLDEANQFLNNLNLKLQKLQNDYDEKSNHQRELKEKSENLSLKLDRAVTLVESLSSERLRWIKTIQTLDNSFEFLPGHCLLAAAFIFYMGPFNTFYREQLLEKWQQLLVEHKISFSSEFKINDFLADAVTIREWTMGGLPSDDFSIENGVIVTKTNRWPLIIDPQSQANKWIKSLESKQDLKVIDFGQFDFIKILEDAVQHGKPVLVQNTNEIFDPVINPILKRTITVQGGQKLIKFNDKHISYNDSFRLYITTKLNNPQYSPEIVTRTTLVNFAIKETGLQDQLLAIIVRKEKPLLEKEKNNLVTTIARNRRILAELDSEILRLLNESRGSLLEDDELFSTLQTSQETAVTVTESLSTAEITEIQIDISRKAYEPSAHRAAVLFFVLMDMSRIDPMYQFSLSAYILLFMQSIEKSPKSMDLSQRINNLNKFHTYAMYRNTCRGLFEKHKLLFAFYMCAKILEASGKLGLSEYNFLLNGGIVLDNHGQAANPASNWISEAAWNDITELDKISGFHGIVQSFQQYTNDWKMWYMSSAPENSPLVGEWNKICTEFNKMLFIRALRPDRMSFCLSSFISRTLGQEFVEFPVFDLASVLDESLPQTPLIFVLSPGVDPTTVLIQFAEQRNMSEKLFCLSLGQGQAPIATKMLAQGANDGNWVFLANCHLSLSWMPTLDKIVETLQTGEVNRNFRLWVSSNPHPEFPISLLQSGIKMTTEPPRGIRANLKRMYNNITEEQLSRCRVQDKYKKLLFSLCFFHTVLLERKKFQQLGWNVIYNFNDSDFEVSENLLTLYLNEYPETPWDALKYLIAGINYGGHVTDEWDQRLLSTYINHFFNDSALTTQSYKLSSLTTYYIPKVGGLQFYKDFIEFLPLYDRPEAYGQHQNAEIASLNTETQHLFEALVSLQIRPMSRIDQAKEGKSLQLLQDIYTKLPEVIDLKNTSKNLGVKKSPKDVVLLQELERYNALLERIGGDLQTLEKGIQGLVVMDGDLEDILNAIFEGKVPRVWSNYYQSMKPLASWTRDLILRVEHFSQWAITLKAPFIFWLSAFTLPNGFLTAVLQTFARTNKIPIDEISWDFVVSMEKTTNLTQVEFSGEGALVDGLFLEGAGWSISTQSLQQPLPMELITTMPVIQFKPVEKLKRKSSRLYECPTYYFPQRSGAFIISIGLKSGMEVAEHWIKSGTAMLLSLAT